MNSSRLSVVCGLSAPETANGISARTIASFRITGIRLGYRTLKILSSLRKDRLALAAPKSMTKKILTTIP
jgi:hypothetical protein